MSNAPEVRRADQSMSHDATLKSLQEGYSPTSTAVVHAHAKKRPRPLWVISGRRTEILGSPLSPQKRTSGGDVTSPNGTHKGHSYKLKCPTGAS